MQPDLVHFALELYAKNVRGLQKQIAQRLLKIHIVSMVIEISWQANRCKLKFVNKMLKH